MAWAQRLAAACLFLLGCGGMVPQSLSEAAAQENEEKPVAVAGEEKFYEKDYLPKIQGRLYELRKQEHELKRQALEEAINRKLVSAEARKRGITEEELIRLEVDSKVAEPTEAEVEEKFVAQLFRSGGQGSVTKDQIRQQLKQSQMEQARQEYFRFLQARAGVEIHLPLPRVEVNYNSARVRGNPDAPITIVEFSDFHCPFCLRSYTTMKTLLQKYEGKIKLAYRDLPLQEIGSGAPGSAEAARCAGEQEKFWEYHDLLFENQDYFGEAAFTEYAENLDLDLPQFAACLQSGKFQNDIQADFQEGLALGITGTPAFFINGIMVNGAQPQPVFEEVIQGELARLAPRLGQ